MVYSKGPDRKDSTTDDKYDNINVPYQPPLALVSAKWVDKNQSGAVDTQNVSDELHLTFSRKLGSAVDLTQFGANIFLNGTTQYLSTTAAAAVVGVAPYGPNLVGSSKVLVYKVAAKPSFTVGQDYLMVTDSHGVIFDVANPINYCLSSQKVYILPQ